MDKGDGVVRTVERKLTANVIHSQFEGRAARVAGQSLIIGVQC